MERAGEADAEQQWWEEGLALAAAVLTASILASLAYLLWEQCNIVSFTLPLNYLLDWTGSTMMSKDSLDDD